MQALPRKYDLIVDPNEIIVNVVNPKQVKATLTNYTVYTLCGSDIEGNFDITRRYSDFDHVRSAIIKNWPGFYIPPLPRKKVIGNNEFLFIESRRKGLEQFCKQISSLKHLWYSRQFQVLLRGKEDVDKSLKQIEQQDVKKICQKYSETFKGVSVKQCSSLLYKNVDNFHASLKKISSLMGAYKQSAKSIYQNFNSDYQQFENLLKTLLPNYEKTFLSTYLDGKTQQSMIFGNSDDKKLWELIQGVKKSMGEKKLQTIFEMLQKEDREVDAILQAFKVRNSYQSKLKQFQSKQKDLMLEQNKLNAGKQSFFKSLIKSDVEEQKKNIQISIDLNQQRIKIYQYLCDLMTVILNNYEIPRFQEEKINKYYKTISEIAQFEIAYNDMKEKLCDYVLSNPKICQMKE